MHGEIRNGAAVTSDVEGESSAIAAYDACLSQVDTAHRTYVALMSAQQERGLTVRGKPLCTVLRPRFLAAARRDRLAAGAAVMAAVLERAGSCLLASDGLLEDIGVSEAERDLWRIDPGYAGFTLTSRLDSFMCDDRIRFIEYNAESPAGIAFADHLGVIFNDLPAMRRWQGNRESYVSEGCRHLLDVLLWAYHQWGGSDTPSIAVTDWKDVVTHRDFELCADYFRAQGIPVVIADPRALEYRAGKLWCGGERITLVYRRVLLHELLDKSDDVQPLLTAYREGAVCMANSPRSKLLHKKTVLAMLSEGSLGVDMTADERALVEEMLPWTRRVRAGETVYQGQTVNLVRLLLSHGERFVIKPADDYGGRGIVLGWERSTEEWEDAVETALHGDYVVQEQVDVPRETYPMWDEHGLRQVPLLLDTNPLLFRGETGSILTRLSGSALLNVSAGTGSAAPTYVLGGEEN